MKRGTKKYLGAIVLGLNDALIELTGALAGLTFALQNARIIAIVGLITGIAASMSMAASEYLSAKADGSVKGIKLNPKKAAFYTGFAYILTVLFLIFPYFILNNVYISLIWALFNSILVIFAFTYFASIEKGESFIHRFFEMLVISLGIAVISFVIGYLVRILLVKQV